MIKPRLMKDLSVKRKVKKSGQNEKPNDNSPGQRSNNCEFADSHESGGYADRERESLTNKLKSFASVGRTPVLCLISCLCLMWLNWPRQYMELWYLS